MRSGPASLFPSETKPRLWEVLVSPGPQPPGAPPSPGPSVLVAAGDGAADQGGTVLFSSNQRQTLLVRMVITITRQALSADGRGCGCRGHAVVVGESQTRQTRGVRVQEGPALWCVCPRMDTHTHVLSTPLTRTPGPLVPRLRGHTVGTSSCSPLHGPSMQAEGLLLGFLPSPKRDDLRHYKIKAPKP